MTEPTTTVTIGTVAMGGAAGIAAAAPQFSDLAFLTVAAIAGAAVQLSSVTNANGQPQTKLQAAWYLLVTAGMAFALTSALALGLERLLGLDHTLTGMPIAFLIGARRQWVIAKLTGGIDKFTGTQEPKP